MHVKFLVPFWFVIFYTCIYMYIICFEWQKSWYFNSVRVLVMKCGCKTFGALLDYYRISNQFSITKMIYVGFIGGLNWYILFVFQYAFCSSMIWNKKISENANNKRLTQGIQFILEHDALPRFWTCLGLRSYLYNFWVYNLILIFSYFLSKQNLNPMTYHLWLLVIS